MPAILHEFEIPLTRRQARQIGAAWRHYGADGGVCVCMNPSEVWTAPSGTSQPSLEVMILDARLASALHGLIRTHAIARPSNGHRTGLQAGQPPTESSDGL